MISYMIDLVSSMSLIWAYALNHVFGLAFIASVPLLLRYLILERD